MLRDDVWRATVSPDGAHIAFLSESPSREVWLMGAGGEAPRKLVTGGVGDAFWELAWSPDGKRLMYAKGQTRLRDIVIESIDLDGNEATVVLSDPRLFQYWRGSLPFCWTADGCLVHARQELPPNDMTSNLWEIRINPETGETTGSPARLTQIPGYNFRDLSLTADGKRLSFLLENNQADVYVGEFGAGAIGLDTVRRLTLDERYDYPFGWTRDSRAVLFSSNRGPHRAVFKQDLDQQVPYQIVVATKSTPLPISSPDGSWVLYRSSGSLMRVPISGGPSDLVLVARDVYFRFHCSSPPAAACVLGERENESNEYVFSSFDPIQGRGEELTRIGDRPPFTHWDLSPDGSRVAVVHYDNQIRIVDLSSGEERTVSVADWTNFEYVAWSKAETGFYANGRPVRGSMKAAIVHVDFEGAVTVLRQARNQWHVMPRPSPDGRYLAFGCMIYQGNAWMIEDF